MKSREYQISKSLSRQLFIESCDSDAGHRLYCCICQYCIDGICCALRANDRVVKCACMEAGFKFFEK